MPLRQTSAEVSASGLTSNSALEAVLELKRLKIDLVLTTHICNRKRQAESDRLWDLTNDSKRLTICSTSLGSTQWRWARVLNQFQRVKIHLDIRSLPHRRIATAPSTMSQLTMLHDGLMTRNIYTTAC